MMKPIRFVAFGLSAAMGAILATTIALRDPAGQATDTPQPVPKVAWDDELPVAAADNQRLRAQPIVPPYESTGANERDAKPVVDVSENDLSMSRNSSFAADELLPARDEQLAPPANEWSPTEPVNFVTEEATEDESEFDPEEPEFVEPVAQPIDASPSSCATGQTVEDPMFVVRNPRTDEPIMTFKIGRTESTRIANSPQSNTVADAGMSASVVPIRRSMELDQESHHRTAELVRLISHETALQTIADRDRVRPSFDAPVSPAPAAPQIEAKTTALSGRPDEQANRPTAKGSVADDTADRVESSDPGAATESAGADGLVLVAVNRAMQMLRDGRYGRAVDMLSEMVTVNGDSAQLFGLLGEAYYHARDYRSAHVALSRSIELYKHDARANYFVGCTLLKLGDKQRGHHYLLQAHELDPMYPPTANEALLLPR